MTVDGVQAHFAGADVRFVLSRDPAAIASLEAAIGPAFAAFGRFQSRTWRGDDVRQVLAHAWPAAELLHGLTRVEPVDAALVARPATAYASLAVKVLEAFLFGIEAADAVFDDRA